MPHTYSNVEYADMIFVYGFCNGNALEAVREYARRFPNRRVPNRRVFSLTFNRLRETGSFLIRNEGDQFQAAIRADYRRRNCVQRHFDNNPETSIRRASAALAISRQAIWRTLKGDNRYPYHLQKVQNLLPQDYVKRLNFSNWFLEKIRDDNLFPLKIIWTDEATFTRGGIVNQRNYHVWALENPRAIRENRFQHEFAINVWLGIWNGLLVGPYFLPGRLNGITFTHFLENDFSNYLDDIPLQQRIEMWFQLDGCPAHYSRVARAWLDINYPQRWIGRGGVVPWPPRSPDMTPMDFFVWGTLKQKVYSVSINSREQLRDRIIDAVHQISSEQCLAAIYQVSARCNACIGARGQHFEQYLH